MSRHALLIGNQHYGAHSGLAELPAVEYDLRLMSETLAERGQFTSIDVHHDVGRQSMVRLVAEFYDGHRSDDMLLFYFTGHGLTSKDDKMFFLAGTDAATDIPQGGGLNTGSELWTCLNETRAGQRLILLDCCFSGAIGDAYRVRGRTRASIGKLQQARGTFIITASARYQTARERTDAPGQPSIFTQAVVEALRNGKAGHDENGWLTAHKLSEYLQNEVPRESSGQTPQEFSEGVTGQIPVALVAPSATTPGVNPDPAVAGVTTSSPAEEPPAAPLDADRWRRLLGYYVACMRHEARLGAFLPLSDTAGYGVLPAGPECVLTSLSGRFPVPPTQTRLVRDSGGEGLMYGYPLVIAHRVDGSQQRAHLTPLLLTEVATDGGGSLTATWPPQVNPALVEEMNLDGAEREQLAGLVESRLVRGDRSSLRTTVGDLMRILGLADADSIDPDHLDGSIQPGPADTHVRNAAVLYRPDATPATIRGLLEDYEKELAPNTAKFAATALAGLSADTAPLAAPEPVLVTPEHLNEAQETVVKAAMTRRLTVAQGPPGTGKSQLVGALIATATAAGQTVVLASTNNQPVDDVTGRANGLAPGLVMRTGNKAARAREPEILSELLSTYAGPSTAAAHGEATTIEELRTVACEADRLRRELARRHGVESDLADLAAERSADVAADNDPMVPLPDDGAELTQLMHRARRATGRGLGAWWQRRKFRRLGISTMDDLVALADRAARELHWRERCAAEAELRPTGTVWRELEDLTGQMRRTNSRSLVREQVRRRISGGRLLLESRKQALQDRKTWRGFDKLLTALPAWATSSYSARTLPPHAGLFDLLIVDESAQCNIAHILPLLYRAKRALFIGDPQQLQPVVQLIARDEHAHRARAGIGDAWMEEHHLSFTQGTAYAAAVAATGAPFLLNEHYRCHPDIVAVPNRRLYDGKLSVLTDLRRLAVTDGPAVQWINRPGEVRQPNGRSAVNEPEAHAVVDQVAALRARYPEASIGIVTPFRAQSTRLNTLMKARDLTEQAGTVHKLQGSERDIIVLSPVGAPQISPSTRRWLLRELNLWNVAITRAKARLVVVGDRDWWQGEPGMVAQLAAGGDLTVDHHRGSLATEALAGALLRAGITPERHATLAGQRCDFLLTGVGRGVGVIVDESQPGDGYPLRQILGRIDAAERSGIPVYRVPAWRALSDPDEVVTQLTAS